MSVLSRFQFTCSRSVLFQSIVIIMSVFMATNLLVQQLLNKILSLPSGLSVGRARSCKNPWPDRARSVRALNLNLTVSGGPNFCEARGPKKARPRPTEPGPSQALILSNSQNIATHRSSSQHLRLAPPTRNDGKTR